jgi:hypothetical protein
MANRSGAGSRQREMFCRSTKPSIDIDPKHPLVVLADILDWTDLNDVVQGIRQKKLKNMAGRPPHLRAMIGAVILMALRDLTYREAEDQIRHYGPARYLCGLTEADWTPDFTTIQDFTQLMGEEGVRLINEHAVKLAVAEKLADPRVAVADTTAQEAAIPYPNEMGLMSKFLKSVSKASNRAGGLLKGFTKKVAGKISKARKKVREYHLLEKTKEGKKRLIGEVAEIVEGVQRQIGKTLEVAEASKKRLKGYGKVAHEKVKDLHVTMKKLLPQVRKWLETGKVATGKIVNLFIPELYSIVRGKTGKAVEFGLKWGVERLKGGFVLARVAQARGELHDLEYAVDAVRDHKEMFGKAPKAYAFDRGGYSQENVAKLKELGVKEVGLAPRGRAKWTVAGKVKEQLVSERSKVEGSIGTIKGRKYGFNRPRARSVEMMGACGQRAVLGLNLNNLVQKMAKRERWVMEC